MQERRLKPGDVLDDYCPRERRITDHAVVAMIDDLVKQTRCVTCDTEHEYKQARVPARKKKAPAALFDQVLDGLQGSAVRTAQAASRPADVVPDPGPPPPQPVPQAAGPDKMPTARADASSLNGDERDDNPILSPQETRDDGPGDPLRPSAPDDIPFRRPLIRAQLPKIEGQVPTRTLPDFTIRQPQNGRPGRPGGGGRRRPGGEAPFQGPMRSGRTAHGEGGFGQGQGQGRGRGPGRGPAAARPERGGQAPHRGGRGRRGKKP